MKSLSSEWQPVDGWFPLNAFCPGQGPKDNSCSSSGGGRVAPAMPRGNNDWAKIAKQHTDSEFSSIADKVVSHVNQKSFGESVDWQAKQFVSEIKGYAKKPGLARARAALELFASDIANGVAAQRIADWGRDRGQSGGTWVGIVDRKEAWKMAWDVGQGRV